MKHTNRCLYTLGLVLLVFVVFWACTPGDGRVSAQTDTLRPTPTNEGAASPVPDPSATPVPPTATPVPPSSQPPSQPRQETVANPAQASGQATVPHTGLLSPGTWRGAGAAVVLLGVIFGARYLRRRERERDR